MTRKDDYCQFEHGGKTQRFTCRQLGYDWPPPEKVMWGGRIWVLVMRSRLTEEQLKEMPGIVRGAVYRVKGEEKTP